ncbi:MAG: U32 family peptidase C-terminal domain-containing protein, partial [Clostridia bacterium]
NKHENEQVLIEIKNKLSVGDTLELIVPNEIEVKSFKIEKLYDSETGEEIQTVNPGKLGQTVRLLIPFEVKKGWILRRKK